MTDVFWVSLAAFVLAQSGLSPIPSIQKSEIVQTGHAWEQVVKNLSERPIVSLHATFYCIQPNGRIVADVNGSHDSLSSFSTDRDIPPGGSVTLHIYDQGYKQCSGGADAVILSDGHGEGDTVEIFRI